MQRGTGWLVLVTAVTLAAVPVLRPGTVDGVATALPAPGPPAVGACADAPVAIYPSYGNAAGNTYVYPQIDIGPCTGTRFAEVVQVIADPVQPSVTVEGSALNIDDPNQDRCATAGSGYLGAAPMTGPGGSTWKPVTAAQPSLSRPSARQEAAGQHWLACLVAAPGVTYPEHEPAPYDGTLRDALATGAARDRLGACPDTSGLDAGYSPGGCGRPHTTQLLAVSTELTADTPREQLTRDCASVAATLIGRSDPTAAGALGVLVDAATDPVPAGSSVLCGVTTTGERTLSGGLTGLGDRALPWT